MAKRYGVPFQGSKNSIAKDIVAFLPQADTLVDICAGGCAITHCALESGKWDRVVANDINPLPTQLFWDAIHGQYHNCSRWVSREEFEVLKSKDPYVRLCWSFGNNGCNYLYGRDLEPLKRDLHNVIFKETIHDRYMAWRKLNRDLLQSLERLESLESLERLEISNLDYEDVPVPTNSIIYADIPYEGTDCKGYKGFEHQRFYEWAYECETPLYFSSYENISDNRFERVWGKVKSVHYDNSRPTKKKALECIYANRSGVRLLNG